MKGEEGRHPTLPLLTPSQAHYSQDTTGLEPKWLEPKWLGLGLRVYLELDTRDATHAGRSIAKHGIAVHR